ncbi:MAG: hypothetical protein IJ730_02355 [Alphaproteobacteria bacterium]|nr:hypothetical protein [Alphaproteobacteria bacterium]
MKKIVTSTALAALLAPYASADTAVVTAHEEPAVIVEQAPEEECCTPDFGGVSFILGIGGSFLKEEIKNKDKKVLRDFDKSSKNINRFMGTVGFGYGSVLKNKIYVGGEFLVDFTKNKKHNNIVKGANESYMKVGGMYYSLGLRLGYVVPKYNTMVYFKVAGSHSSAKAFYKGTATSDGKTLKANKIVPTLALGVEKAFSKKLAARLEGEYRFRAKKKSEGFELKANDGFNIRALVSYNVRF